VTLLPRARAGWRRHVNAQARHPRVQCRRVPASHTVIAARSSVIRAKAGSSPAAVEKAEALDSRLRGNDGGMENTAAPPAFA